MKRTHRPVLLTTDQAASRWARHGHDADYYSRLCRQGKLRGARKRDGEWQIPLASLVRHFEGRR